jgi:hypothetical protein
MTGDSEHIEVLRCGPRSWNEWRAENPSIVPNLVGLALSIGDRQMGPINGGPINLAHARLRHAFLRFATLTGADLVGADLADTDLREARLEGANLSGADLSDADLTGADLSDANLASANLCGADLSGVRNVTLEQLHAAEGDKTTVLPASMDLPLIWTVGQSEDAKPAVARPAPRREPQEQIVVPAPNFLPPEPAPEPARVQHERAPAPVEAAPRRAAPRPCLLGSLRRPSCGRRFARMTAMRRSQAKRAGTRPGSSAAPVALAVRGGMNPPRVSRAASASKDKHSYANWFVTLLRQD